MESIIDYRGKTPRKVDKGIPLVTAKIIKGGRILEPTEFIDPADYDTWMTRGIPKPGSVVLTTEAPLGEVAQLDDGKVALAQRVITLSGKPGILDNTFLKYLLQSSSVQAQLQGRSTGTTVLGVKQSELRRVILHFPSLENQIAIAHILGTLDDKIDLNRRINDTLESMAHTLFKSWFIDFDPVRAKMDGRWKKGQSLPGLPSELFDLFPAKLVIEKGKETPEGWKSSTLGEMLETISETFRFASGQEVIFLNTSDILMGEVLVNTYTNSDHLPGQAKKRIRRGDILFSEIRPANGRYAFVDFDADDYVVSTKLMVLRAKNVDPFLPYFLLTQKETVDHLQILAESRSGTFPQITFDQVKPLEVVLPEGRILERFVAFIGGSIERRLHSCREIKALSGLRDSLLPQLVTGQIEIKNTDQFLKERGL